jgi:molecular chaperone DnaK
MAKIIGIDLGTTNSCVAVVDVTTPQVIPNREGSRTTPSVVGFTEDGERLVGQIAKRQAITNPFNTVFAIKRLIGRKFDSEEVARAKQILPYQMVAATNGDLKVRIRDREYSPEEVSAFVLMEIEAFAGSFLASRSPKRSSPCRRTSTTPNARPRAMRGKSPGLTSCASSTSPPRRRWPTVWTTKRIN